MNVVMLSKPTTSRSVFAMNGVETLRSENLVLVSTSTTTLVVTTNIGFITTNQAKATLEEGAQGYVILSFLKVKGVFVFDVDSMEVVRDFADVFPKKGTPVLRLCVGYR
ncbi:hypothetical protein CR513_06547, partial [Mucuna pruriens]